MKGNAAFCVIVALQLGSAIDRSAAQGFSIVGKSCPADSDLVIYNLIDGNAQCNPNDRNAKACMEDLAASDYNEVSAYNACMQKISDCSNQVFEWNNKISQYNSWIRICQTAAANRNKPTASVPATKRAPETQESEQPAERSPVPSPAKSNPGNELSSRPNDLARRLNRAEQKAIGADKKNQLAVESLKKVQDAYREDAQKEKEEEQARAREKQLEQQRRAAEQRAEQDRIAEQARIRAEANRIPAGWIRCACPEAHFGKWVNGVKYHLPGPECP
jgi:hypothetical protein